MSKVYLPSRSCTQSGHLSLIHAHTCTYMQNGYVFRLKIHHHRELVLLKERRAQVTDSKTALTLLNPKKAREEVASAHREMVALPILTSSLNGYAIRDSGIDGMFIYLFVCRLQQQFPSFGGGARLCKRWVSSHLLSNHVSDEAVELMVASLFTSPAPYVTPR